MSTTTKTNTIAAEMNKGNANTIADVAQKVQLGDMLQPRKLVKTGLTAATSFDITSAALGSNPAIGSIQTLRVTAGTAAAGHRNVTDAGGTPSATLATISDDGKTLTFEGNVTGFILTYTPRAAVDTSGVFS